MQRYFMGGSVIITIVLLIMHIWPGEFLRNLKSTGSLDATPAQSTKRPGQTQHQLELKCDQSSFALPEGWFRQQRIYELFPSPVDSVTIVYPRTIDPNDQAMVGIDIACYQKNQISELQDWLTSKNSKVISVVGTATATGDLPNIIKAAYSSSNGLITLERLHTENVIITRIATLSDSGNELQREATGFYGDLAWSEIQEPVGGNFIYLIRLNLPLVSSSTPTDDYYASVYGNLTKSLRSAP